MKLVLYINEKQIDCIPVQPSRLSEPAYIEALKTTLELRNQTSIQAAPEASRFYIENVPSAMNRKN